MTYSVIGLMDTEAIRLAQLGIDIRKHSASLGMPKQRRNVVVLGIDPGLQAEDYDSFAGRFRRRLDLFCLLNDMAIEACHAVGFDVAPLGMIGTAELRTAPTTLLTCPYWIQKTRRFWDGLNLYTPSNVDCSNKRGNAAWRVRDYSE